MNTIPIRQTDPVPHAPGHDQIGCACGGQRHSDTSTEPDGSGCHGNHGGAAEAMQEGCCGGHAEQQRP